MMMTGQTDLQPGRFADVSILRLGAMLDRPILAPRACVGDSGCRQGATRPRLHLHKKLLTLWNAVVSTICGLHALCAIVAGIAENLFAGRCRKLACASGDQQR